MGKALSIGGPRVGDFSTFREYTTAYNRWYRRTEHGAAKHKEFERQAVALKTSAIATLKLEQGCVVCGFAEDPEALDFDHTEDNKVMGVSRMVSNHRPIEDILMEAEKCEVVCANHHRVRTADRRATNGQGA